MKVIRYASLSELGSSYDKRKAKEYLRRSGFTNLRNNKYQEMLK